LHEWQKKSPRAWNPHSAQHGPESSFAAQAVVRRISSNLHKEAGMLRECLIQTA
jgi:hypothetical protein